MSASGTKRISTSQLIPAHETEIIIRNIHPEGRCREAQRKRDEARLVASDALSLRTLSACLV